MEPQNLGRRFDQVFKRVFRRNAAREVGEGNAPACLSSLAAMNEPDVSAHVEYHLSRLRERPRAQLARAGEGGRFSPLTRLRRKRAVGILSPLGLRPRGEGRFSGI